MAAARERPGWMDGVDETILEELRERDLAYPRAIAARRGLDPATTSGRCRRLADHGLIERVTPEVTYRVTGAGERLADPG